jgi:hypothetical protein
MSDDMMMVAGHIHQSKHGVKKKRRSFVAYIRNSQTRQNLRVLTGEEVSYT